MREIANRRSLESDRPVYPVVEAEHLRCGLHAILETVQQADAAILGLLISFYYQADLAPLFYGEGDWLILR
jgi:hypothetical protein